MTIQEAWDKRRNLRAEGDKLFAEGSKLHTEGNKLAEGSKLFAEGSRVCAEGDKLYAECDKLYAFGRRLYAEGNLVFYNAVIFYHGNAEIKWEGGDCEVCGVKYFFQEPSAPCEGKIVEFDGVKEKFVRFSDIRTWKDTFVVIASDTKKEKSLEAAPNGEFRVVIGKSGISTKDAAQALDWYNFGF